MADPEFIPKLTFFSSFLAFWSISRLLVGMDWAAAILFALSLAGIAAILLACFRHRQQVVRSLTAAPTASEVYAVFRDPQLVPTFVPDSLLFLVFLAAESYGVDTLYRYFSRAPLNWLSLGIFGLMAAIPAGLIAWLIYFATRTGVACWFSPLALGRVVNREECREAIKFLPSYASWQDLEESKAILLAMTVEQEDGWIDPRVTSHITNKELLGLDACLIKYANKIASGNRGAHELIMWNGSTLWAFAGHVELESTIHRGRSSEWEYYLQLRRVADDRFQVYEYHSGGRPTGAD